MLDYPPPPDRWTHPTAAEELARVRQEVANADGRAALMAEQARNAAELQDSAQAIYWRKKAGESYERASFWRDVLANMTRQPEEGGDEEAQLAGYAEEYERSITGGA
ncbi:MAG: hypothetical protein NTZ05_12585 [Chloroflexi bacterium]|nr:hypothetical protein [Chloroflexota bacterium]